MASSRQAHGKEGRLAATSSNMGTPVADPHTVRGKIRCMPQSRGKNKSTPQAPGKHEAAMQMLVATSRLFENFAENFAANGKACGTKIRPELSKVTIENSREELAAKDS